MLLLESQVWENLDHVNKPPTPYTQRDLRVWHSCNELIYKTKHSLPQTFATLHLKLKTYGLYVECRYYYKCQALLGQMLLDLPDLLAQKRERQLELHISFKYPP